MGPDPHRARAARHGENRSGDRHAGKHFDVIEQALAHQPYLSGDAFGFGDIPLGSFAYAWFEMPIARRSRPNMERWYQQLRARPAYQRGVMSELT